MLHESLTVALRTRPPHPGRTCLHQPRGHPDRPGALPGGGALLPRGHRVLPRARPDDVGAVPGRGAWPRSSSTPGDWQALEDIAAEPLAGDRASPINRITFLVPLGHRAGTARAAGVERAARRGPRVGCGPRRARVGGAHHVRARPRRTGCAATLDAALGVLDDAAEVASTCSSKRPLAALLRYRLDGTLGPEAVDVPRPFAVELERSPREAAAEWDSVGPAVRRRDGAPGLRRRAGPARCPRPGSSGSALPLRKPWRGASCAPPEPAAYPSVLGPRRGSTRTG